MKNKKPLVSVIIPIFNAEEYLKQTIESITSQTLTNIEIILVDNSSTDNSLIICKQFAAKDKRIVIVNELKSGVCSARNSGIRKASGEFIAFVDHDDLIDLNMYYYMYNMAKKYDADLIDCCYRRVFRDGTNETKFCHMHGKNLLFDREYILKSVIPTLVGVENNPKLFIFNVVWNKLYKTDVIKDYHIEFDENRMKYEDRIFTVEFLNKAKTIIFTNKCFYNWINNPGSLITKYNPNEFDAVVNNQIRYRELFGHYLDFNSKEAVRYRINAVKDVVFNILQNRKQVPMPKVSIISILQNSEVKDWFMHLQPKSLLDKFMRTSISNKKYASCYFLFNIKFLEIRLKYFIKSILLYFKS